MKKRLYYLFVLILMVMILPKNTYAAVALDSILEDGKLVIPSIPFDNSNFAMDTIYSHFYDNLKADELSVSDCNSNYTHCTLSNGEDSREVDLVWKYDADVKKIVDEIASKYPSDVTKYILEDVEILNMNINGGGVINNSLQFKKNIQYKNFYIDQRGGGGGELIRSAIGILKFRVDGVLYWKGNRDPEFISHDIVYVPEDATNVAEALQARLEKLFPDHTFEVSMMDDTIQGIIDDYIDEATTMYNTNTDMFVSDGYATLEDYLATKHDYDFLEGAEANLYDIAIDDAFGFSVAVKKDSAKAVNKVEVVTNDVLTSVSIKVIGDAVLPLDTKIEVEKITEGEDYEDLIKILKVTSDNSEVYDLNLFSKSLNRYIREIENGKFEVSIPISDGVKDNDLKVYYVDDDDKVTSYDVTVKYDDVSKKYYAVFVTDHFSTYTLTGIGETTTESTTSNPKTSDNISIYVLLLITGLLGTFYLKRVLEN